MTGQVLPFDERYRCSAISRTTGERCRKRAHPGATVCVSHGAAAPQVKRKARERLEQQRQAARLGKLMAQLEVETAAAHPIDVLADTVARADAMVRVLGVLVGKLEAGFDVDGIGERGGDEEWERSARRLVSELFGHDHLGDGAAHVLTEMYREWIQQAGKLASEAVRIGLDERRVQLEESRQQMMTLGVIRGMFAVLDRFDRMLTAEQRARFRAFVVAGQDEDGFMDLWRHQLDYVERMTPEERSAEMGRFVMPVGRPAELGRLLDRASEVPR